MRKGERIGYSITNGLVFLIFLTMPYWFYALFFGKPFNEMNHLMAISSGIGFCFFFIHMMNGYGTINEDKGLYLQNREVCWQGRTLMRILNFAGWLSFIAVFLGSMLAIVESAANVLFTDPETIRRFNLMRQVYFIALGYCAFWTFTIRSLYKPNQDTLVIKRNKVFYPGELFYGSAIALFYRPRVIGKEQTLKNMFVHVTCKDGKFEIVGAFAIEFPIETMRQLDVRALDETHLTKQATEAGVKALVFEANQHTIGELLSEGTVKHEIAIDGIPIILHARALMLAKG